MRIPISRVRMQRVKPLCASLAITTGACANPHRTSSSTEHQPSTTVSSRRQQDTRIIPCDTSPDDVHRDIERALRAPRETG